MTHSSQPMRHAGRRDFLRRAGFLTACAGTPFAANLMAIGAAAAQSGDHKALVCIFLAGGNDQSNTVIPVEASALAAYSAARPSLALPASQRLALQLQSSQPLALHGALSALKPLFDQQRAAIVANVGPLTVPMKPEQWNRGRPTVPVPHQLFSHSDQSGAWQTGLPDRVSSTGWLGRIGDLTASGYNTGSGVSIAMSVGGNNVMQTGNQTLQYQLTSRGAVKVHALNQLYGSAAGSTALRRVMTDPRAHLLEAEAGRIAARSFDAETLVSNALSGVNVSTTFPGTGLGNQLRMVARMIAARSALGQRRQIFFVQAGGYDFHDNLLNDQASRLRELGDAMAAFYGATVAMGVSQQVTTFTASEFGRALQHNGRGADHGWGSHHFVIGGAVRGNRVYGRFPTVALGSAEDAGQGRLVPTTSVDEYAATLAGWFGVPSSQLSLVLPNLGRFARADMGFLG